MSRLRTLLLGALVIAGLSGPARAHDLGQDDLVMIFAGCTGRLSAEMEFAWLMGDARADHLQVQRHRFVTILGAVMPADRARETLALRIDAKLAHAGLLTAAHFGTDMRRARLARSHAQGHLRACQNMLLDS